MKSFNVLVVSDFGATLSSVEYPNFSCDPEMKPAG